MTQSNDLVIHLNIDRLEAFISDLKRDLSLASDATKQIFHSIDLLPDCIASESNLTNGTSTTFFQPSERFLKLGRAVRTGDFTGYFIDFPQDKHTL